MEIILKVINAPGRAIIRFLENSFRRWGRFVSGRPYQVILTCLVVTALAAGGWLQFRLEHKANRLWIPMDSTFNLQKEWLDKNFPSKNRLQMVLIKSDNILTPQSLKKMYDVHQSIEAIRVDNKTFQDICTKVPIADIFQNKRRRKREAYAVGSSKYQQEDSDLEEEEEYDYDYIWADYSDTSLHYAGDTGNSSDTAARINFAKYGAGAGAGQAVDIERLPGGIYCDLVSSLAERCGRASLLEAWRYSEDLVTSASREEILAAVNLLEASPWTGHAQDYTQLLGGLTRNSSGHVVAATTALMLWSLAVPANTTVVESQGSGVELELGDLTSLRWEESFVEVSLGQSSSEYEVLPNAVSSYGNESADAIFFDGFLMACGYFLMLAYTCLTLGPLRCVENRVLLSLAGISSVILGFVISIGLASVLGYPYTLVHAILPFLCLGIGIDDMFVIMQCLNNVKRSRAAAATSVPELMAETMAHAGVSITVTSVTDVVAFGVGYFTNMPGLQSFCIYASIGLGCIFVLQVTWLLAWLVLDERRILASRSGLLPCLRHQAAAEATAGCGDSGESEASEAAGQAEAGTKGKRRLKLASVLKQLSLKLRGAEVRGLVMTAARRGLASGLCRAAVLATSAGLLCVGVSGLVSIKYKFDPLVLVPGDSYFTRFLAVNDEYFSPLRGYEARVYTGPLAAAQLPRLAWLDGEVAALVAGGAVLDTYTSWWPDFAAYVDTADTGSWRNLTDDSFQTMLSKFLFSKSGSKYQNFFEFESELTCGSPAPKILVSSFEIEYLAFDGPSEHVPGKGKIDSLLEESGLEGAFSFNKIYLAWETDTIIGREMWRNLGLGVSCIFLITFVLLANIQVSCLVLAMVCVTLVDIVGFLYLWNIHIDIVSCINIVISVGLCVDYSVHIGHAYIVAAGSRLERAGRSVETIGPAVLNGGVTTFLALIVCSGSTSHTFVTFFKVFVLTVVFGLYHGLVLLPVLLSLLGPGDTAADTESVSSAATEQSDTQDKKSSVLETVQWSSPPETTTNH